MSIPSKQIGWSQESNLLWELLKELNRLSGITSTLNDITVDSAVTYADSTGLDAFARLRASSPFTLGDYKHIYGLNINFLDELANGGTVTFQPDQSSALLATTSNPASSAIHQTKIYHNYIPGKSQLIFSTICFKAAVTNVTKRTGYFDENDGIYFEQNGAGVLSFCVRTNTSGTPSDASKVAQSSWNTDKCDGTGPSGYNLDITKTQFFFTDFTWLGLGRVRCGFLVNGQFVIAHEFRTSNTIDVPYMANPNLPVRCEIFNTGATTGGSFNQICSTVISEGGDADAGQDWSTLNTTLRSVASGATLPLLAIRLSNTFQTYPNRVLARLQEFSLYSVKEPLTYKVIKLPNASYLTGETWNPVDARSAVEFSVNATAYTDGLTFASGYVSAAVGNRGAVNADPSASNARQNYISQNYSSTDSEIYVIVATNLGTTATTAGASVQWREIY
jgi:hypothetical protein